MNCPSCGLINPDTATRCDCGYEFKLTNIQESEPSVKVNQNTNRQAGGLFAPEKRGIQKGVLGGLAMMGIALVWFIIGYEAGYIFYYPPILFLIGLYALIKGMATGNYGGEVSSLTSSVTCPKCTTELVLNEEEIANSKFVCPVCSNTSRFAQCKNCNSKSILKENETESEHFICPDCIKNARNVTCTNCKTDLTIDENEFTNRQYICPVCNNISYLN